MLLFLRSNQLSSVTNTGTIFNIVGNQTFLKVQVNIDTCSSNSLEVVFRTCVTVLLLLLYQGQPISHSSLKFLSFCFLPLESPHDCTAWGLYFWEVN